MKKILVFVFVTILVATVFSSCASRKQGCPTTNPHYFRR